MEFVQRKIKREKEGFGPCARQNTKECKGMLRNKIEQINLFNSTLSSNKFRNYACFYCTQKGHVVKSCPTKLSDERLYAQAGSTTFKHGDEVTRARIRKNKKWLNASSVMEQDTLQTRVHKTTPKQRKNKKRRQQPPYHHCPNQKCTLAYMFKDRRGKNINLDKMREQHNNYLEDYFDALDRSANIERKIEQPYEKKDDDVEIGKFHECVAFLDLIRKGWALSNEWKYIGTNSIFEDDFEGLAEVLGLERSDGLDIRRCYLDYLEPLVTNYKATRSSNPIRGYENEGIGRFEDYHGDVTPTARNIFIINEGGQMPRTLHYIVPIFALKHL
nr:ARID DNA-binding domain-containing protein [Tanacetum cinerariifolium]